MKFSPQQDAALVKCAEWFKNRDKPWFYLAGYAGTGKTTLAQHLAQDVSGSVLYGAYTGKAAGVMRNSGCIGATTIHRLMYVAVEKSKRKLMELEMQLKAATEQSDIDAIKREIKEVKESLKVPRFERDPNAPIKRASLVVIDECSMVNGKTADDLMSYDVPILVLGDPAQLPPVGGAGFFTRQEPDVMLTEIHRQAKDSPIIRMATDVRENGRVRVGEYGDSRVLPMGEKVPPEEALLFDQMLVGRNSTRKALNKRVRGLKNFQHELPEVGDKIVCLKNNHDLGLLNGEVWLTTRAYPGEDRVGLWITNEETEAELVVDAHAAPFRGEDLDPWTRNEAEEFDYGYGLTVHKAQGSQWGSVLVFDESSAFPRTQRRNWLYTAITRASDRVTIAKH